MRGRVAPGFAGEQEVDVAMSVAMLGADLEVSPVQLGTLRYVTSGFMGENDVFASMSMLICLGDSCLDSEGWITAET
jgi:hypothetical protein